MIPSSGVGCSEGKIYCSIACCTGRILRGHVAIIMKSSPPISGPWCSIGTRPSPDFSPQLRDKIWEWPGDKAKHQVQWTLTYPNLKYPASISVPVPQRIPCRGWPSHVQQRLGSPSPHLPSPYRTFLHSWTLGTSPVDLQSRKRMVLLPSVSSSWHLCQSPGCWHVTVSEATVASYGGTIVKLITAQPVGKHREIHYQVFEALARPSA